MIKSEVFRISLFGILLLSGLTFLSKKAEASFFSSLLGPAQVNATSNTSSVLNSQNMPLPQASLSSNHDPVKGAGDVVTLVEGSSLLPETGPSGSIADIEDNEHSDQISVYVVHKGDTLSEIAEMFGVSVNTVIWANDIQNGVISVGQTLVILPVSGINYTIKSGDTIQSIAKKFKGDEQDILRFNGLEDGAKLVVGAAIIIPDGEIVSIVPSKSTKTSVGVSTLVKGSADVPNYPGYYARIFPGGVITQGIHGYNAVDLGVPLNTPVHAAASGIVIISKDSGWNGGFGKYVVIKHPNGTETLYAHFNDASVSVGQSVDQGDLIGYSGSTGKSTGPHVHFEVRGARNPAQDKGWR